MGVGGTVVMSMTSAFLRRGVIEMERALLHICEHLVDVYIMHYTAYLWAGLDAIWRHCEGREDATRARGRKDFAIEAISN